MESTIRLPSMLVRAQTEGSSIISCSQVMSPPAEKARPAPVSTTTSVLSSASISVKMRDISSCICASKALSASGRFIVNRSTRSCRSIRIVS